MANLGSLVTLSSGSATSTSYTPSAPGTTYEFQASYGGDTNYNSATGSAASLTVNKATPSLGFSPSTYSITLGGSATPSATVTGVGSTTPSGTLTFYYSINSGGSWTQLGSTSPSLSGSGNTASATAPAAYTPTSVSSTYMFGVTYSGDTNYAAISTQVTVAITVNKATATVSASSFTPSSPISLGTPVTVSASVTGLGGVTAPSGNVQFMVKIGAGSYANFGSPATLSGSSASISYTPSTATTYSFEAVYQGDTNYVSGTTGAASGILTVNMGTATVNVPTLNPSATINYGSSVTCTVTVSGVSGGATPTGTVQFQVSTDSGSTWTNLGSAVTLSSGSATSASYTPAAPGTNYQFHASYSGDTNYNSAGPSSAVTLTVNMATPTIPAPTLNPVSPISYGSSVTAKVTLSGVGSGVTPIGQITFQVSTNSGSTWSTLGAVKTLVSGSATSDSYTPSAPGSTYQFRAQYGGDTNYNSATGSAASLTVNKATPTVPAPTLNPSGSITAGNPVSLSVTISGGSATPTGTATFQVKIGSGSYSTIGSAVTLNSGGSASTTYTPTTAASDQFQVIYNGDTNYNSATSSAASLTVNPSFATYFGVSGFTSPTVAGAAHSVTVTAYDAYGNVATYYAGTVAITSSDSKAVLPPNALLSSGTGSFSVTLETAGTWSITATDTVTGSITGSQSSITVNAPASITLVGSPSKGTSTSSTSIPVTLSQNPTSGDVLIAVIGTYRTGSGTVRTVSSITGGSGGTATWHKITAEPYSSGSSYAENVEIWEGIVSSASTSVTITISGSTSTYAVADICEYSGIATSSPYYDQVQVNTASGTSTSTGTTAQTAQASELWIGGITVGANTAQTTPANGFTLLDGNTYGSAMSVAYLQESYQQWVQQTAERQFQATNG